MCQEFPHTQKISLLCGLCPRFEDWQHRSQVRGISGELSIPCLPLDRQRASTEDYLIYFDPVCLTIFFMLMFPNVPELNRTYIMALMRSHPRSKRPSTGFCRTNPRSQGLHKQNRCQTPAVQWQFSLHMKKFHIQLRERCLLKLDFCQCFLAVIGKDLDCQQSCFSTEVWLS